MSALLSGKAAVWDNWSPEERESLIRETIMVTHEKIEKMWYKTIISYYFEQVIIIVLKENHWILYLLHSVTRSSKISFYDYYRYETLRVVQFSVKISWQWYFHYRPALLYCAGVAAIIMSRWCNGSPPVDTRAQRSVGPAGSTAHSG